MSVKLGTDSIRTIAAFEKMTKVHARDCLIKEDSIYFLVDPARIGVAIGKNGANIKEVSRAFGKTVRLFAYHDNPQEMIKAMVPTAKSVDMAKGNMSVSVPSNDRVAVIGKNGRNIKAIKELMNRHFSIKTVKLR
jgi:transcription termination/antitermination protein NusA